MSERLPFSFDEDSHLYRLDNGLIVPGHTRVLELGGLVHYANIAPEILERKSEIGREVHRVTKMYDDRDGNLKFSRIDPRVEPFVSAYVDFRRETKFIPFLREYRDVYKWDSFAVGMTIDAYGDYAGRKAVVEIKTTSQAMPHHGVQLAAQAALVPDPNLTSPLAKFLMRLRIAVYLRADGRYKIQHFTDRGDFEAFRAALYTTYWKMQHEKFYKEVQAESF